MKCPECGLPAWPMAVNTFRCSRPFTYHPEAQCSHTYMNSEFEAPWTEEDYAERKRLDAIKVDNGPPCIVNGYGLPAIAGLDDDIYPITGGTWVGTKYGKDR